MSGGYPIGWQICHGTDQGTLVATSTSVTVTSSSTAGTYGSYTQIVASSAIDACLVQINLAGGNFSTSNNLMVKLAIGGAGSEVDIIKDLMFYNGGTLSTSVTFAFPIAIAAGTRLSAAIAPQASGVDNLAVQVILYDGSHSQIEGYAGADSIGFSSTHGTTVTAGAANVKGSYAQLTASTSRDYLGFCFAMDGNGTAAIGVSPSLLDIAVGGAGSEQIIIPNYLFIGSPNNAPAPGTISDIYFISIPAATRIAARFQNVAGSGVLGLTLYGIYQ